MNKPYKKITVVGAGSWGTVVASLLSRNNQNVVIWGRNQDVVDSINDTHINKNFLPQFKLPENLRASSNYDEAFTDSNLIVWAIPAQFTRERIIDCKQWFNEDAIIVNLAKGIEAKTLYRPSQVIAEECRNIKLIGSLGGPNIASEISNNKPATATLAIDRHWEQKGLNCLFSSPTFKVDLSPHLVALELSGALKNIVAIASGVCDGLDLGWNIKSTIIAQGFREMQIIGGALGGSPDSFASAFGLGDLIVTCSSKHSRNRTLGESIGKGDSLVVAEKSLNGRVAEGIATTASCYQLADKLSLETPILSLIHELLFDGGKSRVCIDKIIDQL